MECAAVAQISKAWEVERSNIESLRRRRTVFGAAPSLVLESGTSVPSIDHGTIRENARLPMDHAKR